MEKVIKLLGGKKNGTDHTGVFDIPSLLKTLVMALLTFGSVAFSAGAYFGSAKDMPVRMDTMERKQDRVEANIEAILANQAAMAADIRELRSVMMSRGRDAR